MQKLKEEEISKCKTKIAHLFQELKDSQTNEKLLSQQIQFLKEEIRNLQRGKKRETVNLEYLKNIIFKFITTKEDEKLLPVLCELLQFSPEESKEAERVMKEMKQNHFFAFWHAPAKKQ